MAIDVTKKKATPAKKPAAKKPVAPKKETAPKNETANAPANEPVASNASGELVKVVNGFEIRRGVPVPPRTRTGGGDLKYPFDALEIGDHLPVPVDVDKDLYTSETEYQNALKEGKRAVQNRLSGAARRYMKSHPDVKLAVRVQKDGSIKVRRVDAE